MVPSTAVAAVSAVPCIGSIIISLALSGLPVIVSTALEVVSATVSTDFSAVSLVASTPLFPMLKGHFTRFLKNRAALFSCSAAYAADKQKNVPSAINKIIAKNRLNM